MHVSLSLQADDASPWTMMTSYLHNIHTTCTGKNKHINCTCIYAVYEWSMHVVAGVQCFGEFSLIIDCFRSEGSRVRSGWGLGGSGNVYQLNV